MPQSKRIFLRALFLSGAISLSALGGCGTYTPDIDAGNPDPNATAFLINKIVLHVACELREAVQYQHNYDVANAAMGRNRVLAWLDNSQAKVSLKLIAEEKGTLSPGVAFKQLLPGVVTNFANKTSVTTNQSFSAAFGALASSDATRTENVDYTFSVKKAFLGNRTAGAVGVQECNDQTGILLFADLKIKDWLFGTLFPFYPNPNGLITAAEPDTLTHEVNFVVMVNGSFTPSWTLVNVSANTAGTLAMAGRNTTGDVIISIGKASTVGEAHNIAKLNSGVNSAVKSGAN